PGYQRTLEALKPCTRQRFVAIELGFPGPAAEAAIVATESGVERGTAVALVELANRVRTLRDRGLAEVPSTRLLIAAGRLVVSGIGVREACNAAVIAPLSDDPTLLGAMRELVDAMFP